jgi:hypothetical protein
MRSDDYQKRGWAWDIQMFWNRLFFPHGQWDKIDAMHRDVTRMRAQHGDDAITAALGEREGRRK